MSHFSMEKRLNISVDLDSTLARTMDSWINELNRRKKSHYRVYDIVDWDLCRLFNISKSEVIDIFDTAVWCNWSFRMIPPTEEGLSEKIRRIKRYGRLDVVTVLPEHQVKYSKRWLSYHGIQYDNFVLAADGKDKIHMPYDVFIDDNPALADNNGKIVLLYDQPWNQNVETGVIRVYSFDQVIQFLDLSYRHLTE